MYDSTNKQILSPVSIADMQKALGRYSYSDIGGLVTYGDINIWSRCKPFRMASLFPTDEELETARYNANTGFSIPSYTSIQSLFQAMKSREVGSLVWTYQKPDGANYPFRFKDFIGYQRTDTNPIDEYSISADSKYYEDTICVENTTRRHHTTLRLKLTDMRTTASLTDNPKIGVVWGANESDMPVYACTVEQLDNNDLVLPESTLVSGKTYSVVFFYSYNEIPFGTLDTSLKGNFVPLPYPTRTLSVSSEFGIRWRGRGTHLGSSWTFNMNPVVNGGNSNGERMLDTLSFHVRSEAHYSTNGGGLYTITDNADNSGKEQDVVLFSNTGSLGQNIRYISSEGYSSVSGDRRPLSITFSFNVNPNGEGVMTFVRYRHLVYVGMRWHQVTVITPVSVIFPADNEIGLPTEFSVDSE